MQVQSKVIKSWLMPEVLTDDYACHPFASTAILQGARGIPLPLLGAMAGEFGEPDWVPPRKALLCVGCLF